MKTIVITGSTRGIGFALAKALLNKGNRVVISGRTKDSLDKALKLLSDDYPVESFAGFACDVREFNQVQALWNFSIEKFGNIDIWINNAGISNRQTPPWALSETEIRSVIETNMLGEIFGAKVALTGFLNQDYGAVYNLEGMGAQRRRGVKGLSIYGATKAGLRYFNDSVPLEIENDRIILGAIQPGMVLTDMVTSQYEGKSEEWDKVKGILTTISEDVDIVAEWLADKIIKNKKNGVRFTYGGMLRIIFRMIFKKSKIT